MRFNAPARFEQERDLLHHLVALAPPSLLAAQGGQASHCRQISAASQDAHRTGQPHWLNASSGLAALTLRVVIDVEG